MISALLPRRLHATALGIFMAAGSLGGVLGVAVGGYVAARWGWRQAFFAVAIPGLAIALLFMLTVRDIPTAPLKVMDQTSGEQRKLMFRDVLRNLFCTRSLVAVYLAGIGYVFFAISLIAWLPSYFARVEGLPMDRAAARSALVLLTTSCGTAIGGVVIDRLSSWRTDMMLVAPAVFAVISAASIASAFTWLNGNSSLTALLTGAFFSMTGLGSLYAVTQRVVYPGLRATGIGVTNLIWQTLGGMGPLITGVVSDAVGIRQAIACDTLALLFCAIAMFVGSRTLQSDASRISAL